MSANHGICSFTLCAGAFSFSTFFFPALGNGNYNILLLLLLLLIFVMAVACISCILNIA